MPKLIMTVSLIVGIGAMLGMIGYLWTMPKADVVIDNEAENEEIKDSSEEEKIITEIKYVCEQETNKNKDGCYIRNARTIALTDYNKAKIICDLVSELKKDDCALQILAIADIDRLKIKCEYLKEKIKKEQCYNNLVLKISETDFNEAINLCETKSSFKDNCYTLVAEKISFTRSVEIYSKALTICDKIKWQELKESCKENCKWNYEYEQEDNETADWKTYRNEEYGFEIKYPEDWEEINKTPAIMSFACKGSENNIIQIRKMDGGNDISLIEQIKRKGSVEPELIKINNKNFYFLEISTAGLVFYEYYIENENKIFIISMMNMSADLPKNAQDESDIKYPTDEDLSEELNILRIMVFTFKFTE